MNINFFNPTPIATVAVEPELLQKINQLSLDLLSVNQNDYLNSDLTLRGGLQRRVYPGENLEWLQTYFETKAREFQVEVCKQAGDFRSLDLYPKLKNCWTITQSSGSYQVTHSHPYGNISGNLYLETPTFNQSSEKTDGCLSFIFEHSQDLRQLRLRDCLHFQPIVGTMIIFPSWLPHQVYPWQGQGQRRVIAWDCCL